MLSARWIFLLALTVLSWRVDAADRTDAVFTRVNELNGGIAEKDKEISWSCTLYNPTSSIKRIKKISESCGCLLSERPAEIPAYGKVDFLVRGGQGQTGLFNGRDVVEIEGNSPIDFHLRGWFKGGNGVEVEPKKLTLTTLSQERSLALIGEEGDLASWSPAEIPGVLEWKEGELIKDYAGVRGLARKQFFLILKNEEDRRVELLISNGKAEHRIPLFIQLAAAPGTIHGFPEKLSFGVVKRGGRMFAILADQVRSPFISSLGTIEFR